MTGVHRSPLNWLTAGAVLVLIWVAMWGDLSWANVLSGVAVAAAVLAVIHRRPAEQHDRIRVGGSLRLIAWFSGQLIVASVVVAREVLRPKQRIRQGIVAIPLRTESRRVETLVANIISLIPGTLTLEAAQNPPRLYVHVLHLDDVDDIRAEVAHLEDLVTKAVMPSLLPLDPPTSSFTNAARSEEAAP